MKTPYQYVFPAIRGIQARREYFVSMCPLRLISKIFLFDEEELVPEIRAQRILNRSRIPQISGYLLENRDNYVFSAITASVDAEVEFEAFAETQDKRVGLLRIPMSARFIINDGQHRRAAIEHALRENPDLGDETIAVVFFLDLGLERCQQMFADLNRYAVRPSKSLGVLYDHRDDTAQLARLVVAKSELFRDLVEKEKTNLSPRSRKLFTLSAIYSASKALFGNGGNGTTSAERVQIAIEYWETVAKQFPEWQLVKERKMTAGEVRRDFIHSHGIVLHALGKVGHVLLQEHRGSWQDRVSRLKKIDWYRSNAKLWEGRAMIGGRVSKARHNLILTTNTIKGRLDLALTPEERRVEAAFKKGEYGS